jgi:two-component sensor histidine kinase
MGIHDLTAVARAFTISFERSSHRYRPNENRLVSEGPDLILTPKAAEQIGLALQELATNAAKHGPFPRRTAR